MTGLMYSQGSMATTNDDNCPDGYPNVYLSRTRFSIYIDDDYTLDCYIDEQINSWHVRTCCGFGDVSMYLILDYVRTIDISVTVETKDECVMKRLYDLVQRIRKVELEFKKLMCEDKSTITREECIHDADYSTIGVGYYDVVETAPQYDDKYNVFISCNCINVNINGNYQLRYEHNDYHCWYLVKRTGFSVDSSQVFHRYITRINVRNIIKSRDEFAMKQMYEFVYQLYEFELEFREKLNMCLYTNTKSGYN